MRSTPTILVCVVTVVTFITYAFDWMKASFVQSSMSSPSGTPGIGGQLKPPANDIRLQEFDVQGVGEEDFYVGNLFECGWYAVSRSPLFQLWFPRHKRRTDVFVSGTSERDMNVTFSEFDVFIASGNPHKPSCEENPFFSSVDEYHHWLQYKFPGKVLMFNGEANEIWRGGDWARLYRMGGSYDNGNQTMQVSFLQKIVSLSGPEHWRKLFDPRDRAKSTKERFMIYAQHHCFDYRDEAFLRIAAKVARRSINPKTYFRAMVGKSPVAEYTECDGIHPNRYRTSISEAERQSRIQRLLPMKRKSRIWRAPDEVVHSPWDDNPLFWRRYRFCLCMENEDHVYGYLTEKILNAFWAGCIPIFYGSRLIFDIFNEKAFIFYDITNETAIEEALERIYELEHNEELYDKVLAEPILRNGWETVDKYFSLSAKIGNATLMKRVHQWMGLPPVA